MGTGVGMRRKVRQIACVLGVVALTVAIAACSPAAEGGGTSPPLSAGAQLAGSEPTVAPAPAGEELTRSAEVPPETVAVIADDAADAGDHFEILFEPYGYGPDMPGGEKGVIIVVRAGEPSGRPGGPFDPIGRNLLVSMKERDAEQVASGGVYMGVLGIVARAGSLGLRVEDVRFVPTAQPSDE